MVSYDTTGIEVSDGGWKLLPDGDYTFKIIDVQEKESTNRDYQVVADCAVVEPSQYKNVEVRHWVTFFKDRTNKGAGISIQFLKAIDQPWEGKIDIIAKNWIGKRFRAHVVENVYEAKDGSRKTNNKIKYLLDRDHAKEQDAGMDGVEDPPEMAGSPW